MFIIVGLGNPSKEYEGTRHNAGFEVIDRISDKYNISVDTKKHRALIGKGIIGGQKVILAKPQTFMNLSGESVRSLLDYYKVDEEQELISRAELDQIDKKQGHISEKSYYTDEYLELIKMHLPMFEDFGQKVQFVLENSEAYTNPEMGYADRKWRMEDLIGNENKDGLLFSKEEKYKINMIDCYREIDGKKHYELCIVVNVKGGKDI